VAPTCDNGVGVVIADVVVESGMVIRGWTRGVM